MRQYDETGDNSAAQKTTAGEETILQAGCDDQSQQWKGLDEAAEDQPAKAETLRTMEQESSLWTQKQARTPQQIISSIKKRRINAEDRV